MKNKPLISVIIPVYNAERYLGRCLDSVLGQTYHNTEIILIEDGSTDDSRRICREYAEKDSRIKLYEQKNCGVSVTRNLGVSLTGGEYVAFVDADDFIQPFYLERLLELGQSYDADIVQCSYEQGKCEQFAAALNAPEIRQFDGVSFLRAYFDSSIKGFGVLWNKLYRASVIKACRFPEGKVHEDTATIFKMVYDAKCVVYTDEALYYYFMSEDSIMRKPFALQRLDWRFALQEKLNFLLEKGEISLYRRALQEYQAVLFKLYYSVRRFCPKAKAEALQLKQEIRECTSTVLKAPEVSIVVKILFCLGFICPYLVGSIIDKGI